MTDGVKNTGKIIANGGSVMVTAKAAAGVLDNVINMTGVVEARSVGQHNGEIVLSGGTDPSNGNVVRVAGKLDASGKKAGQTGGNITITGDNILFDTTANIDVSGDAGGGNVFIGGNFHGAGPLPNANAVVMLPGAAINANAITNGNGGQIALWSEYYTNANGSISATGGAQGGNGGFIETSSHNILNVDNLAVYTSAPAGTPGTWLLDPWNVTISTGANVNPSTFANPFIANGTGSNVNTTSLDNSLSAGSSVTIQTGSTGAQAGTITLSSPIAWTSSAGNTLTLQAAGAITLNAPVTIGSVASDGLILNVTGSGVTSNLNSYFTNQGYLSLQGASGDIFNLNGTNNNGNTGGINIGSNLYVNVTTPYGLGYTPNNINVGVDSYLIFSFAGTGNTIQNNTSTITLNNGSRIDFDNTSQTNAAGSLTLSNPISVTGGSTVYFQTGYYQNSLNGYSNTANTTLTLTGNITANGSFLYFSTRNPTDTIQLNGNVLDGSPTGASIAFNQPYMYGTLQLGGANTYTGTTYINQGTLSISSESNIADTNLIIFQNNGTLKSTGTLSDSHTIELLSTTGTISPSASTTLTLNGLLENGGSGGALADLGTGTLVLTNANTYTGGTTIGNASTNSLLEITNQNGLGTSGNITLNGVSGNGSYLILNNNSTSGPPIPWVFANTTGTISLSNFSRIDYENNSTIGTPESIVENPITVGTGGGVIQTNYFTGSSTPAVVLFQSGSIALGSNNLTFYTRNAGDGALINEAISGTGGSVTLGSSFNNGVVAIGTAATYTGPTNVQQGTLDLGVTNAIQNSSSVTLSNVANTAIALGAAQSINDLSGGGTTGGNITLGGYGLTVNQDTSTTYSGVISGTGAGSSFTVQSANGGYMYLTNVNTYAGPTTIGGSSAANESALVLETSQNDLQGTSGITVNPSSSLIFYMGGTLSAPTNTNTITLAAGANLGFNTFGQAGTLTLNNPISLSGTGASITTNTWFGQFYTTQLTLGGNITLNGNNLIVNHYYSTGTVTTSGNILDGSPTGGSITLNNANGGGTLILNGSGNTYTGATTIDNGTIQLGVANAITNSSSVTLANGGTLNLSGLNQTLNNLSDGGAGGNFITNDNATLTIDESGSFTYAGVISGSGGVTFNQAIGGNILYFKGVNTYSGPTSINGYLELDADSGLGTAPASATANSILLYGYGWLLASPSATNLVINANRGITLEPGATGNLGATLGGTLTYNGIIAGSGRLWTFPYIGSSGASTTILGGNNTFTGGVINYAGDTLQLNNANAAGVGSTGIILNGGNNDTLNLNFSSAALGNTGTIDSNAANITFSGTNITLNNAIILDNGGVNDTTINGSGSGTLAGIISSTSLGLTKSGTGTITLSGANTYGVFGSVGTTLSGGTLIISGNSAGSPTITSGPLGIGNITFNGGTLESGTAASNTILNAYNVASSSTGTIISGSSNGLTLSGAGTLNAGSTLTINNSANTVTLSGNLSGAGNLTMSGAGTLAISGSNNGSLTGAVTLTAGTLQVANDANASPLGTGSLSFNGGTLVATIPVTTNPLTNNFTLNASSIIGGTNNITLSGTGTFTTGTLTVSNTGTTTLSGNLSGAAGLTENNGSGHILAISGSNNGSFSGAVILTTGTLQLGSDANASPLGTGSLSLNGGTLTATTAITTNPLTNNFTLNASSVIGGTSALTLSGTGTFTTGTLTVSNTGTTTLSGNLSGAASLTENSGSGDILAISGANNGSFSGAVTLTAGTLQIANDTNASPLGTGALSLNGGTLVATTAVTSHPLTNNFTLNNSSTIGGSNSLSLSGTGTFTTGTLTVSNTGTTTLGGNLSGAASLTENSGSGDILAISGTNNGSFSGIVTLTLGTLQVANDANASPLGTGALHLNGGTLVATTPVTTNPLTNNFTLSAGSIIGGTNYLSLSGTGHSPPAHSLSATPVQQH